MFPPLSWSYLEDSLDTRQIEDHRGSYSLSDPEYLGSSYNQSIEWEIGEITCEPLTNIMADVKHCGKFQARLAADGLLTKKPTETVYSGVVSFRNLRLAMFLVELNNLQLRRADVGNVFLQAPKKEKLYTIAGQEFEEIQ